MLHINGRIENYMRDQAAAGKSWEEIEPEVRRMAGEIPAEEMVAIISGHIAAFVAGQMDGADALRLFSALVRSGLVDKLPPAFRHTADQMIEVGFLAPDGEITKAGDADIRRIEREQREAVVGGLAQRMDQIFGSLPVQ
jgi:hypothetical protein